MHISKIAQEIEPSLARKLFNMAKDFDDVIDLTLGDPDLPPPVEIGEAAYKAIKSNLMHYSANAGLISARKAIVNHIKKSWDADFDENKNIIVTVGGMQALYLSMLSMINPGDEVIVFAPYYANYVQMIMMCGGKPIIVNAYNKDRGFYITKEMLQKVITDRTIAIIINSPNNPTGAVIDREALRVIADVAVENDLVVITDEVYRTLLYDNKRHESILQFEDVRDRTVLIDSLSKEYSMTGWRIGYACGPEELIKNMTKLQENVAACAPLPSQYALVEAYNNEIDNIYILKEFENRRNALCNALAKCSKISFVKPDGTFYLFVNIEATGLNSFDFASKLLTEKHVATVPGITYGSEYDHYVRIAFTKDITILEKAANLFIEFCEEL